MEAGVAMPEVGVEAREEFTLDNGKWPLTPFIPECTEGGLLAPQAMGVGAAAAGLGPPPRAGKASSDCVFIEGKPFALPLIGAALTGGAIGSSLAFCLPAAFSDIGSVSLNVGGGDPA